MRKVTKGKLGDITFQLNPSDMVYNAGANWAMTNSPGMPNPLSSYSGGKEKTFTFELWLCKNHEHPVDMGTVFNKLNAYRNSKEPVLFAYGSFVCRCVVTDCPFNIEKWNSKLSITHMRVPITLRIIT